MNTDVIQYLLGPNGGIMSLVFGAGASAGYIFAVKTIFQEYKKRIEMLEVQVKQLQEELLDEARKFQIRND